jgi:shikimate dehydrogenase
MKKTTHPIKVALIGSGTSQSKTPAMHMAEGRAQGINYNYVRFDTLEPPYCELTLSELLNLAEKEGFAGLNITHPFKMEVPRLLHELSPEAQILGAVNTVVFRNGLRFGYNTDYSGFRTAFQKEMADANRAHVLLVGTGGAGSAVALALTDSDVRTLSIFDKSPDQAIALTNRLSVIRPDTHFHILESLTNLDWGSIDGVVNATPMGMDKYPGVAINVEDLPQKTWVTDIVYFPLETELLRRAKNNGCRVMNGSGMAISQAVDAFRLLTGLEPDPERFTHCFKQLFTN